MDLTNCKVGNILVHSSSTLCFKIIGETKTYWKLDNGDYARKKDGLLRGTADTDGWTRQHYAIAGPAEIHRDTTRRLSQQLQAIARDYSEHRQIIAMDAMIDIKVHLTRIDSILQAEKKRVQKSRLKSKRK